jgi:small subunit ribosomal protein S17
MEQPNVDETIAVQPAARPPRRVKLGVVRSDKMDKTITVVTETRVPHPTYKKIVRKSVRFKAHDEKNEAKTGDTSGSWRRARCRVTSVGVCSKSSSARSKRR